MDNSRIFEAADENLSDAQQFVDELFLRFGGNEEQLMLLEIAVEEIFVNISHYAYPNGKGNVKITVSRQNSDFIIEFSDNGVPFNPLMHTDPNVTKLAQSNQIGGLGIFMVKKYTDALAYRYENGCNILTLTKKI